MSGLTTQYLHGAIASSTRKSYAAAIARYEAWCRARGHPPLPLQTVRVANWLAELAHEGDVFAATIGTYRSALHTYHRESVYGAADLLPSPSDHPLVGQVLKGIERSLLQRDRDKRAARPALLTMTPARLEAIRITLADQLASWRPDSLFPLIWAAATTATYALLRPSELLGSSKVGEERALRPEQIAFFRDDNRLFRLDPVTDASKGQPALFEIRLAQTKADQGAENPARVVAAAPAVTALWQWMQLRSSQSSPLLFATPSLTLRTDRLLSALQSACEAAGMKGVVQGKAFRQGGASGLMAQGVPVSHAAQQGQWRSARMAMHYADEDAAVKRQILINRTLAPAAASSNSNSSNQH